MFYGPHARPVSRLSVKIVDWTLEIRITGIMQLQTLESQACSITITCD